MGSDKDKRYLKKYLQIVNYSVTDNFFLNFKATFFY